MKRRDAVTDKKGAPTLAHTPHRMMSLGLRLAVIVKEKKRSLKAMDAMHASEYHTWTVYAAGSIFTRGRKKGGGEGLHLPSGGMIGS